MAKSNTRKYIIWGSAAVLLGAVGYMLWKKYRKPKDEVKTDVIPDQTPVETPVQTPVPNSSSTPSGPTAAQTELATKYRTWANSTDALSQKWGKKSKYDLDATGSYNKFFLDSYNGGGKAEYEASLKASEQNTKNAEVYNRAKDGFYNNKNVKQGTNSFGRYLRVPFNLSIDGRFPETWVLYLYPNEKAGVKDGPIYNIYQLDSTKKQAGYWNYGADKKWTMRSTSLSKIGTSTSSGAINDVLSTLTGGKATVITG